jgi:alpha-L-fucosidase 2
MLGELPPYPIKEKDGHRYLDAAEIIRDKTHNAENVALWTVFPFRVFGAGRPELEMMRYTFETRPLHSPI